MKAVLDSVVVIGMFLSNDQWHKQAMEIMKAIDSNKGSSVIITDFILAEILNFLQRKGSHEIALDCLVRLEENANVTIERIDDRQFALGKDINYRQYPRLSFVDSLTIAYMKEKRIKYIYSFDSDFDGIEGIVRLSTPGR